MNENCPYCEDDSLRCFKCHRRVLSGKAPEYPGHLCSECWEKHPKAAEETEAAKRLADRWDS